MGPNQAVTITLPGPPVAYAVEPARLVAWLVGLGWRECASRDPGFCSFEQDGEIVSLEIEPWDPDYARAVIVTWAHRACLTPHALAALLATPPDGPAFQWAHMSDAARTAALDDIEGMATILREGAGRQRTFGRTEAALAAEGRAMGLEAAAAVLRGGQRG